MGGLFSTLSKQLLGNLFLASGLPAVLFVFAFQALIAPRLPETWHVLEAPEALEAEWKVAIAALAVLGVATALTALNRPIIRLYEGYPIANSWTGYWFQEAHATRAREAEIWWRVVREIGRGHKKLRTENPTGHETTTDRALERSLKDLTSAWQELSWRLPMLYPESERVLPTRLGNAIRAFEDFTDDKYGLSSIALWPRLAGVLPDAYKSEIASHKQRFDLMLNLSVVCGATALAYLLLGLLDAASFGRSLVTWSAWAAWVSVLATGWWAFYRMALPQAIVWGDSVKSGFDLYRWDLLEQLGFEDRPRTMSEERDLWTRISHHLLAGRLTTYKNLTYRASSSSDSGPPGFWDCLSSMFRKPSTDR